MADINFTWEQEWGLWTTGVSSGNPNGGRFVLRIMTWLFAMATLNLESALGAANACTAKWPVRELPQTKECIFYSAQPKDADDEESRGKQQGLVCILHQKFILHHISL